MQIIESTRVPTEQKTLDDIILEKNEQLTEVIESGQLIIISNDKTMINGNEAYVINAEGQFSANEQEYNIKFKEVTIYGSDNYYTFSYSNGVDDFDPPVIESFTFSPTETPNRFAKLFPRITVLSSFKD